MDSTHELLRLDEEGKIKSYIDQSMEHIYRQDISSNPATVSFVEGYHNGKYYIKTQEMKKDENGRVINIKYTVGESVPEASITIPREKQLYLNRSYVPDINEGERLVTSSNLSYAPNGVCRFSYQSQTLQKRDRKSSEYVVHDNELCRSIREIPDYRTKARQCKEFEDQVARVLKNYTKQKSTEGNKVYLGYLRDSELRQATKISLESDVSSRCDFMDYSFLNLLTEHLSADDVPSGTLSVPGSASGATER